MHLALDRTLVAAGLMAALVAAAGPASAQGTPSVRVRGTVESLTGSTLTVKSRDGTSVPIVLKDGWSVSGVKKASLADIKPGTFVGIAAMNGGSGPAHAMEVVVFPPGVKSGEGHYGWDLAPESTMTNATVASTVNAVKGDVLTLAYPGGEQKIEVTPDIPIVTFAPAEKSDLKAGATVFVPSQQAPDKTLSAMRVVVGNNGIAPPM